MTATPPAAPAEPIETPTPAPAQTPAAAPPADPVDQIKDKLASNDRFWSRVAGKPAPAKTEPEPAPATEPSAANDPEAPAPAKKGKAKAQKPSEAPTKVDPARLAEIQGRESGREMGRIIAESLKPKETPRTDETSTPEAFPEEYQADIDVYKQMEKQFPDKYGEKSGRPLTKKLTDAVKLETSYIEKWQNEHPGETFDGDATEHNDFYERNFPEIDSKDFRAAERLWIEHQAEERASRRANKATDELRAELKEKELKPEIARAVFDTVKTALAAIDDKEFADIDPARAAKLVDNHPIAARIAEAVHQTYQPLIAANMEVHGGIKAFDTKNPAHMALFKVANTLEQRALALAPEDRFLEDGRYFATREDFLRMPQEEQAKHWYVDEGVVAYSLAQDAAQEAKKAFDAHVKEAEWLASKRTGAKPGVSAAAQKPAGNSEPKSSETPAATPPEPRSPSVPSKVSVGTPTSQVSENAKSPRDIFFSRILGR